jgi:aquaporin Z
MLKKMLAEFVGTLTLVLIGCGAAALGGFTIDGQLGIALAFGFAIVAMAYAVGPVSGCHVNPAVSLAVFVAGRMGWRDMLAYWVAQFAGAVAGAAILMAIAGVAHGLGANGWGAGYLGGYSIEAAATFEVVMTALFTLVILGATGAKSAPEFAGLAIGITLAAIHIVGIQVTGVSVNPARSFGPAVLLGGRALQQLWLFIVAPPAGAVISGLVFRLKLLDPA